MALRRNSILTGLFVLASVCGGATFAWADDSTITSREDDHRSEYLDDNYIYDYMDRRDSITVGLGDATTSNLQIMHPTPWPSYINNTDIKTTGNQGIMALENMMQSYEGSSSTLGGSPSGSMAGSSAGVSAGASGGN